jgi:SWI/SNF-related matrix-associated actin-dependent regulator 1 of chromatin subfamily A
MEKKIKVTAKNNQLHISFAYDKLLVSVMHTLEQRRYVNKTWIALDTEKNRQILSRYGFVLEESKEKEVTRFSLVSPFEEKLRPFQKEAVYKAYHFNKRILIADEQGLGKTIEALAFLAQEKKHKPALIICPVSVKYNWAYEIDKWTDTAAHIVSGKSGLPIKKSDFVIINYDIVASRLKELLLFPFMTIVLDEAHYIKNYKAKRTKAVLSVAKKIRHKLALTGTPLQNRPIEMFTTLKLLKNDLFFNRWEYAKRYCGLKKTIYGWDMTGSTNMKELHDLLVQNVMIRRLKKDVLEELPDKTNVPVVFPMKDMLEYHQEQSEILKKSTGTIENFHKLSLLCYEGKKEMMFEWITDFLQTGRKLVLFAIHKHVIAEVFERFKDVIVKIDGSTKTEERKNVVDQFQKDGSIKLFIGNIKAAGTGITLTAASDVAFIQFGLNPGDIFQAEDRVHRITQKKKVNVYYFIAKDTYEIPLLKIIDQKKEIISEVIEGKDVEHENLITELIREMGKQ